jgi:hypothetical protein
VESSSEELVELCEGSASVRQVFWEEGSKIAGLLVLFWRRIRYTTTTRYYGSRCRRCVGGRRMRIIRLFLALRRAAVISI